MCRLSNVNGSVWKQILFPNPVSSPTKTSLPETKKYSQLLFFLQNKLVFSELRHAALSFSTANVKMYAAAIEINSAVLLVQHY